MSRGLDDACGLRLVCASVHFAILSQPEQPRQMATFVNEALRRREDTAAGTHGGDGGGGDGSADKACASSDGDQDEDKDEEVSKRWWIKLCANKHLKDDDNLKRVSEDHRLRGH